MNGSATLAGRIEENGGKRKRTRTRRPLSHTESHPHPRIENFGPQHHARSSTLEGARQAHACPWDLGPGTWGDEKLTSHWRDGKRSCIIVGPMWLKLLLKLPLGLAKARGPLGLNKGFQAFGSSLCTPAANASPHRFQSKCGPIARGIRRDKW